MKITMLHCILPGMALYYPQLEEGTIPDVSSFNRFYSVLACTAQEYAESCRISNDRSFYRMQSAVEMADGDLVVTIFLFHRTPPSRTVHRTLRQIWRNGLLVSAAL